MAIDSARELPGINRQIIDFIETHGNKIAPTYDTAVCTEFVIQIIDHFKSLTKEERKLIRIITDEDLSTLIQTNSPVIKGVQTSLLHAKKGTIIENTDEVRPGDFVQFWNIYNASAYGHCGVVLSLEPNEKITVYSSHPLTNGYGKQTFMWPDKLFFVRLN
jgi:hypothetical protein